MCIYSELLLDFGLSNPIGQPKELQLMVTNTSAVSTTLTLAIQQFKAHEQITGKTQVKEVKQKR